MVMSSYSSVLLVSGGSGITFGLGAVEELIMDIRNGRSSVKFIELVWTTQDRGWSFRSVQLNGLGLKSCN